MKILIAGGTGFVGSHIIHELLQRGQKLRLLVHRRSTPGDGIEQVEGDATDSSTLTKAAEGCDAVINLIGIIREFPRRGITFERLHPLATGNLLRVAKENGIKRFIQMSAAGTRDNAVSGYHKTKFKAEQLVRSSGLEWTILRPSLIYGPKDAFINMLADKLRLLPLMPVFGNGLYRLQPIHADDVARCFAMSLELPQTIGQTYDLCGNNRLSYIELLDTVAAALGMKPPFKPQIPLAPVQALLPLLQRLPQFPITSDQLQMLLEENICDGCWQQTFGFEPIDFKAGIRAYLGQNLT